MFFLRIYTEGFELLQIQYLPGDGDNQYLNTADTDYGSGAETAVEPTNHWTITNEMSVAERDEFGLNCKWTATEVWVGPATKRHRPGSAGRAQCEKTTG
jgi:hypothetical protein